MSCKGIDCDFWFSLSKGSSGSSGRSQKRKEKETNVSCLGNSFFLTWINPFPVKILSGSGRSIRFIWLRRAVLSINVFLTLCLRLQNVLEDFRDMDATALEETKATVRRSTPSVTQIYWFNQLQHWWIITSHWCYWSCESDCFQATCFTLKHVLFFPQICWISHLRSHVAFRINCNIFIDPLTFHLAPSSICSILWFMTKHLQNIETLALLKLKKLKTKRVNNRVKWPAKYQRVSIVIVSMLACWH